MKITGNELIASLTIIDHFAYGAMQGILSQLDLLSEDNKDDPDIESLVNICYAISKAMIAEHNRIDWEIKTKKPMK